MKTYLAKEWKFCALFVLVTAPLAFLAPYKSYVIQWLIDAKSALGSLLASLPQGLHSTILENSLSGGQAQRIGIARANPLYLLFERNLSRRKHPVFVNADFLPLTLHQHDSVRRESHFFIRWYRTAGPGFPPRRPPPPDRRCR